MRFLIELDDPIHLLLNVVTIGIFVACAPHIVRRGRTRRQKLFYLGLGVFAAGVYLPVGPIAGWMAARKHRQETQQPDRSNQRRSMVPEP